MLRLVVMALFVLPGCEADTGADRSEGTIAGDCTDGADNDGDGSFDCSDPGCLGSPACTTVDAGTVDAACAQTRCGAACVDLTSDEANCGQCGHACPTDFECVQGQCKGIVLAPGGAVDCGGACSARGYTCTDTCNTVNIGTNICGLDQYVPVTGGGIYAGIEFFCVNGQTCIWSISNVPASMITGELATCEIDFHAATSGGSCAQANRLGVYCCCAAP